MVRGAHVDDVDVIGGDQLLGGREPARDAKRAGRGGGAVGRRGGDADQPGSRESRRPRVHATDEAGADDPDSQIRVQARRVEPTGSRPRAVEALSSSTPRTY